MSENSKDYAQRPQRNFTFMNSISVLTSYFVESYIYVEQGLKQTHAHMPFVGNGYGRGHQFGFLYSMHSRLCTVFSFLTPAYSAYSA
jgi:hypothetical protein